MMQLSRDPRYGGFWLACDQDMIQERYVNHPRRWSSIPTPPSRGSVGRPASVPSTPQQRFGVLPMTPHLSNGTLPSTPSSPVSTSSSLEYFGAHSRKPSSTSLVSPNIGHGDVPLPMDGGPMRRQRAGSSNRGPLVRPTHKKRQSTDSTSTSWETLASSSNGAPSFGFHGKSSLSPDLPRSMWTLDVGETCVWSIVSTEQKTYTFYVPPQATNAPTPYTPFPEIIRYLPPGQAGSDPLPGHAPHQTYTTLTNLPLITIYGRNFVPKPERGSSDFKVFYGDQMAEHTEVRCPEVMAASEPTGPIRGPVPITLVREDGHCFVPTNVLYTPRSTPGAP
ncbi:hypothetical protein BD324DRAFT_616240 [Kockovaella imperatae]|uniref:IPT/TIG domain-containing protein n=1 Tax=Kockovaella imperatae TaxID=4999 RepID=A0A1Y1UR88_9TREE|nr:hypothetical protein BD324DRAFT_616240 [Kockovaella imperatae]ORX40097.1 hypothetical protein BD324DRAFT_616240 [Kockovaella imperatae]